jgi:hypothetical protein
MSRAGLDPSGASNRRCHNSSPVMGRDIDHRLGLPIYIRTQATLEELFRLT